MDKENNNKEITNDELAQMVAKGFDGVDERFNEVEKKMATKDDIKKLDKKLSKKIDGVEGRLGGLERRIDDIATNKVSYDEFGKIKVRVEKVEEKVH